MAALALAPNANQEPPAPLPAIIKEELAKAQKEDKAVEKISQLKETNAILMNDMRETVNRAARKLLH